MIDFEVLRAFLALAHHGSVSAASRALDCPKSTLSRRLSALEQHLGRRLTRQEGNRLIVTEAGHQYREYCLRILELEAHGRRALEAYASEMEGELRVGLSHEMARGWATRALNEFLEKHPGIRLDVRVSPPGGGITQTDTDLWICCCQEDIPGFRKQPLGRWQRRIYAATALESQVRQMTHPAELQDLPWIGLTGAPLEILLEHADSGRQEILQPTPRLRVDSLQMLADGIARGYGIGILPSWLAECPRHGLKGQFARILDGWQAPPVQIALFMHPGPRPQRCNALIEHLQALLPERWSLEAVPAAA